MVEMNTRSKPALWCCYGYLAMQRVNRMIRKRIPFNFARQAVFGSLAKNIRSACLQRGLYTGVLHAAGSFEIFNPNFVFSEQLIKICSALPRKFRSLTCLSPAKLQQSHKIVSFKLISGRPALEASFELPNFWSGVQNHR